MATIPRRAPRNLLLLLCAMSFVLDVDRVNLATAAGPMQREFGFSITGLGLAVSWRLAFVFIGIVTALRVVVWWWYFRDDPRSHPGMKGEAVAALWSALEKLVQF